MKHGFVTVDIPITTAAMSAFPYNEGLEALYTFESAYGEEVRGAIRKGNTLLVPRESAPYAMGPNDWRSRGPQNSIPVTFTARHEQGVCAQQSLQLLIDERNHIFEAPTGWGKTIVGGWIAARFGQATLIVVTKDDLVAQWRDSLINVLGIPPSLVGHIQGDVCDWVGKQFVIGMVQSLMIPDKYPSAMYRYFGLMVLDEVHQMAAECFVRVCQLFSAKSRLGFSATPNRKDGKTQLLHWHIGPTLVQGHIIGMKPKILVRQTGWRIPCRRQLVGNGWQQIPIPHGPGRMMLVAKAMANSDGRNMEIVNFVLQSWKNGRRTLVMSDLREGHLNRLFQMLTNEGVPGNEIGYYVGGMKKPELKLAKNRVIILGTYKMCATGTDVPIWDTLVMATPRADVTQAVGRVLRFLDDKKQPIILDLVDYNSIFQGFHLARLKQYYEIGAEVVKV